MVWGVMGGVRQVVFPHGQLFLERVVSFGNVANVNHIKLLMSKWRNWHWANTRWDVLLKQEGVVLFKGRSNGWLQYRGWRNEFKCLSEGDGEHIEIKNERRSKEERSFIIEPFGSRIKRKCCWSFNILHYNYRFPPPLYQSSHKFHHHGNGQDNSFGHVPVVFVHTMDRCNIDSSIWCGRDCCICNTSWVLPTSCNGYGVDELIDWVMRMMLEAEGEG